MSFLKSYLGHVDIAPNSLLELRRPDNSINESDVLQYFFCYGLIADQVLMQGSAPLKSHQVFSAYLRLSEAFRRNECHEDIPVFAFGLREGMAGYASYLKQRKMQISSFRWNNAERVAYEKNNAESAAEKLDADLCSVPIPHRIRPIETSFHDGLRSHLLILANGRSQLHDENIEKAIRQLDRSSIIQSFDLIANLKEMGISQLFELYKIIRNKYREINAYGMGAINSDNSPILDLVAIKRFLWAIGLGFIFVAPNVLSSEMLFKIRQLTSFQALRDEYRQCQSANDVIIFSAMLTKFRLNDVLKSGIKHSATAIVTMVFEFFLGFNITNKIFIKGGELFARNFVNDFIDSHYEKRCYKLHEMQENLQKDLFEIIPREYQYLQNINNMYLI